MKFLNIVIDILRAKEDLADLIQKRNIEGINRFYRAYKYKKNFIKNAEQLSSDNLHRAIEEQDLDVVKCVIDNGFNVNIRTDSFSFLHTAINNFSKENDDSLKIVELILDNGFDITKRDSNSHTALHKSIYQRDIAVTQLILEKHPNIINDTETVKNSYLYGAIKTKHLPTIKEIIKAKPLSEYNFDEYDSDPLSFAIRTQNREIIDFLIDGHPELIKEKGTKSYASIYVASFYGDEITFNKILEKEPELIHPSGENKKGLTPLLRALQSNKTNIVNIIIEKDPSLLYEAIGSEKIQPIEFAAKINKEEGFENLIEKIKKYPQQDTSCSKLGENKVFHTQVLPSAGHTEHIQTAVFDFKDATKACYIESATNDVDSGIKKGDLITEFNETSLTQIRQPEITKVAIQAIRLGVEIPKLREILTMGK